MEAGAGDVREGKKKKKNNRGRKKEQQKRTYDGDTGADDAEGRCHTARGQNRGEAQIRNFTHLARDRS